MGRTINYERAHLPMALQVLMNEETIQLNYSNVDGLRGKAIVWIMFIPVAVTGIEKSPNW